MVAHDVVLALFNTYNYTTSLVQDSYGEDIRAAAPDLRKYPPGYTNMYVTTRKLDIWEEEGT